MIFTERRLRWEIHNAIVTGRHELAERLTRLLAEVRASRPTARLPRDRRQW